MVQNIYEQLKIVFTHQGKLNRGWSPHMVNRFISFDRNPINRNVAIKMDLFLYTFAKYDNRMLKLLYKMNIPKQRVPWFNYIKTIKEKTEDYKDIITQIQQYYHWTVNETKQMKPLLAKLFSDKQTLYNTMKFFGSTEKEYKKMKLIKLFKKEQANFVSENNKLSRWM